MLDILPKEYSSVELTSKGLLIRHSQLPSQYAPNTLIIKPFVIGICRSDVKELTGTRTTRHDFGHEIVGEVAWTNTKVSLTKGDIVVFDPHIQVKRGTGFSEVIIATGTPSDLKRAFIKINLNANYKKMVFTEPMSCANHCISRSRIHLGKQSLKGISMAVIGAGNAGTLISLLARYYGASVTLHNRTTDRLEFLEKNRVFDKHELKILDSSFQDSYDVVIPATSFLFPEVMNKAVGMIKNEGLLLLFGGTNKGDTLLGSAIDIDLVRRQEKIDKIFFKNKTFWIAGTYGARTEDFQEVIELLEHKPQSFPVEKLINKEITLSKVPETLLAMRYRNYLGKIIVNLLENL